MGLGAHLDGHAKSSPYRAFVIYRPVILEPTVTVNTAIQPTLSILQIFLNVKRDKELVIAFSLTLLFEPYK
jgi:hypothetical protein